MRSNIIVLVVGLLAAPLSLLATPGPTPEPTNVLLAADTLEGSVNGHALEPAPLPTVGPAGVSPVDRVAGPGSHALDAGPTNSTPFSATPSGTLSEGGSQVSQRDRTEAPSDATGVTPNLGK
jgi:hypothetical protein